MERYSAEYVHDILYGYITEQGESLWEKVDYVFDGEQENYLDFLVSKGYLTTQQKENWIKYGYSDAEYENIEAMTYMSKDEYPFDLMEDKEVLDENYNLNIEKARELGLVNVPLFIEVTDVAEFNKIYWNQALKIIAEYMSSNLEIYGSELHEMEELVNYYRGND